MKGKTIFTPVYYDGKEVKEEYEVVDLCDWIAAIRIPDMPSQENEVAVATSLQSGDYYEATIEYQINEVYAVISRLRVFDPLKRGQHRGQSLICHVLRQLGDDQIIQVSPSANPSPVNMNDIGGPVYGLHQKELETYYKRFSYGSKKRHILFTHEKNISDII